MKTTHVNDEEIQRFAFDHSECAAQIIEHINTCASCQERVETYQSLSAAVKELPAPIPDYDLSQLVLAQLPAAPAPESSNNYLLYAIILTSAGMLLSVLFIFQEIFLVLFSSTSGNQIILLLSGILFGSFILGWDIVKSFHRKLSLLN